MQSECFFKPICEATVALLGNMETGIQQQFEGLTDASPAARDEITAGYEAVIHGSFGKVILDGACLTLPGGQPCDNTCPIAETRAQRGYPGPTQA